jgi:hypothetical protein
MGWRRLPVVESATSDHFFRFALRVISSRARIVYARPLPGESDANDFLLLLELNSCKYCKTYPVVMKRAFLVIFVLASAVLTRAQLLSNVTFAVTVSNLPLHDVSLLYHGQGSSIDETKTLTLFIRHLASGTITGTGAVNYTTQEYSFAGDGNLRGRYRSLPFGDRYGFALNVPIFGDDAAGDAIGGRFRFHALIRQAGSTNFTGSGTNEVCVRGYECTESDELFYVRPRSHPWMLRVDLNKPGSRIRGTAEVVLISHRFSPTNVFGREFHYAARGRFNARSQRWLIRLLGTGEDRGSSLLVRANSACEVESIRGRLLGQRMDSDGPFVVEP